MYSLLHYISWYHLTPVLWLHHSVHCSELPYFTAVKRRVSPSQTWCITPLPHTQTSSLLHQFSIVLFNTGRKMYIFICIHLQYQSLSVIFVDFFSIFNSFSSNCRYVVKRKERLKDKLNWFFSSLHAVDGGQLLQGQNWEGLGQK